MATEAGRRARAEAHPHPTPIPPEAQAQAFTGCALGAWGPGGPQRANIACIPCSHFLAHLDTHHEPMAGAIRWVYNAPRMDCAVTRIQHQEVAQLYAHFNAEFSAKPRAPSLQGIPVGVRHILYKAMAAGLPESFFPVCPTAVRDVTAYLEHNRLDPATGCFDLDRAMNSAHRLAQVTNGHRRDTPVRTHSRANAAAHSLARLVQAAPGSTAVPQIYRWADTNVPDDHVIGFLDFNAIRTVLLLLDAARAERQRHGRAGDPHPAVHAPLEGDMDWTPWSPRAFAAIAEQAQTHLDAHLGDAPANVRSDRSWPVQRHPAS